MKKLAVVAIAATTLMVAVAPSVQAAGTLSQSVDVSVTLTSACQTAGSTPSLAFTYEGFQAVDATATDSFDVQCTKGHTPVSVVLDAGDETVAGLLYTITVGAPSTTAGAAATDTAGAGFDTVTYALNGTIVAGQPGETGGDANTAIRTLTISY